MAFPVINNIADLVAAIDIYITTPRRPVLKGEEVNVILKKTVTLLQEYADEHAGDVSGKADKNYVDDELELKADTTQVEGYVNNLAANIGNIQDALDDKANSADVNAAVAGLVDTDNTLLTAIGTKAEQTYVDTQDAAVINQISGAVPTDANNLLKLNNKILALQSLLNGDDINLDTIKELADAIKSDEGLIALLTTNKLNTSDVYNSLDYLIAGKALDARQGKVLNDAISALNTALTGKLDKSGGTITGNLQVTQQLRVQQLIQVDTNASDGGLAFYDESGYERAAVDIFNRGTGNGLGIGAGTNNAHESIIHEVRSTAKGSISDPPMTKAQRLAINITNPVYGVDSVDGLRVYQTDDVKGLYQNIKGIGWVRLLTSADGVGGSSPELVVITGNTYDYDLYSSKTAIWKPTANADLAFTHLPTGVDYQLQIVVKNADDLANTLNLTINGQTSPAVPVAPTGLTHILIDVVSGTPTYLSDYNTGGGAPTPKAFLTVRNPSTSSSTPGGDNTNTYAARSFDIVVDDTETKWDATTQKYAIPRTGRYRVTLFVTLLDGAAGNTKFSMGAGVSAADSDFNAQYEVQGNGYSQSFTHVFYTNYNANDQVMMYTRSNGYNYFRVYSMTIEEL